MSRLPVAGWVSRKTSSFVALRVHSDVLFGTLASLFSARQFNFYKIVMIIKRFFRNTRKPYFGNRLKLRTNFRYYRDSKLENSFRICRWRRCCV